MIAGYATAFIILAVYVASLYTRNRNLNQDLDMLKEMEKTVKQSPKPVTKKGKSK
jgi:hypothetical protein